jgi:hypothetical protein
MIRVQDNKTRAANFFLTLTGKEMPWKAEKETSVCISVYLVILRRRFSSVSHIAATKNLVHDYKLRSRRNIVFRVESSGALRARAGPVAGTQTARPVRCSGLGLNGKHGEK